MRSTTTPTAVRTPRRPQPSGRCPALQPRTSPKTAGLSAGSRAALAETAAAFTALRLAQARCYRAITSLEAGDAVAESGYRNLSRLLNDHVRIDDKEATRLARHARSLPRRCLPPASLSTRSCRPPQRS